MVDYATIRLLQKYLLIFIDVYTSVICLQRFISSFSNILFLLIFYFNLTTPADWLLYSGAVAPADA